MIRIFAGWDQREAKGFDVFVRSLIKTSKPGSFSVTPIWNNQRDGSNSFTYSRFLVPYLCDFQGWAIWMDGSDMLVRNDIADLWALRESWYACKVVKHDYQTKHSEKYLGTDMECSNEMYPKKNWSSVIIWDCGHYMNRVLTRDFVASSSGSFLHRFSWLPEERVGEIPKEWNHLVGEQTYDPDAKLVHYTLGIPGFQHYQECDYSEQWRAHAKTKNSDR